MKRILAALLVFAVVLTAAGCSAIFDKEYTSVRAYEAESGLGQGVSSAPSSSITNYNSLKQAVLQLVSERAESAELQFLNYDGNISQDISSACWEVKSSTALGAFAVDYISYDLSRIVSFYQAEIHITYKRSADQIAAVESVPNMTDMSHRLETALRENRTYLAYEISVASATAEEVRGAVEQVCAADPTVCPVVPTVDVGIFPESGVSRILEITINYNVDGETLTRMREELSLAVQTMTESVSHGAEWTEETYSARDRVYDLCQYVMNACRQNGAGGSTAWDALVGGTANSEGLAMALMAGCQAMGVECIPVEGRLDGESHVWNMVTVDGQTYHVDVSNWKAGEENVFLVGDEVLLGSYWWDTELYPACAVTYAPRMNAQPSVEPGAG